MAYGDIGAAVLNHYEFDTVSASGISTHKVAKGFLAIFYTTGTNTGKVSTYSVTPAGVVGGLIDTWTFESGLFAGLVVEVSVGVYLAAYRTTGNVLKLATIAISASGVITKTFVDSLVTAYPTVVAVHGLCKKPDVNLFVASWHDIDQDGWIATITCDTNGADIAVADTWEFEPNRGVVPKVTHAIGTYFVVAYSTAVAGSVSSISITNAGVITESLVSTITIAISGNAVSWSHPLWLNTGLFVIGYARATTIDGYIASYTISAIDGSLTAVEEVLFESVQAVSICVGSLRQEGGTAYIAVYYTENSTDSGIVRTYSCSAAGDISAVIDSVVLTDAVFLTSFSLVEVHTDIWAVSFNESPSNDGYVDVISISTVPEHETFPSSTYNATARVAGIRHIYRPGSYRLEATIGDVSASVELVQRTIQVSTVTPPDMTASTVKMPEKTAIEFMEVLKAPEFLSTDKVTAPEPYPAPSNQPTLWERLTPWDESQGQTFGDFLKGLFGL